MDWPRHFSACGVTELVATVLLKTYSYVPVLLNFPEIKDHQEIRLGIPKC